MLNRGDVSRSKVLEIIRISVQTIKVGIPTYLNSYEEALVVALAQIKGAHGLPIDFNIVGAKLKFVIKAVNSQQSTKDITANSSSNYTYLVIKQVNRIEDGHDTQSKKIRTGLVKVSSISNYR